jgi:hypothetical protein
MSFNPLEIRRKRRKAARKRARRERRAASQPAPVPFVIGVNRSGTTLLRMMLDSHPDLAIPPETHFIPALSKELKSRRKADSPMTASDVVEFLAEHRRWGDFGLSRDALLERIEREEKLRPKFVLRAFFGLYAESQGKSRYGDKTPGYVKQMGMIQRSLPEARFIHLIRDGRDVAISREGRMTAEELSVERHAKIWKRRIGRARRQAPRIKRYLEVRYEDLIEDPEPVLRTICEFIQLPYDPAMLAYHERSADRLQEIARDLDDEDGGALRPAVERIRAHSLVTEAPRSDRVGRWRELMDPGDVARFEAVAGDLLDDLGYEVSTPEGREAVASSAAESASGSGSGLGGSS